MPKAKDLFKTTITNINTHVETPAFTHAFSHLAAVRNFSIRFPFPPNVFDEIKNDRTGLVLTREEYFEMKRNTSRED